MGSPVLKAKFLLLRIALTWEQFFPLRVSPILEAKFFLLRVAPSWEQFFPLRVAPSLVAKLFPLRVATLFGSDRFSICIISEQLLW